MNILEDYRALRCLVAQQTGAIDSGDARTLESLTVKIQQAHKRIQAHSAVLSTLTEPERAVIAEEIRGIQEDIGESIEAWQQFLGKIRDEGRHLQATRRYFSALQSREETGGRFSIEG